MVLPTKIEMPNQIKPNQRKEWNQFELEHNHIICVIRNEWFDTLSLSKLYTVFILRITLKWYLLCVMVNDPKFMLKRWLMFEHWVSLVGFDVFQNIYSFLISENMSKAWQHFPNQNFNKICECIEESERVIRSWLVVNTNMTGHNVIGFSSRTFMKSTTWTKPLCALKQTYTLRTHTHTNPIILILWMRKHFWLFDFTIFMRVDEFTSHLQTTQLYRFQNQC